jgi:hypothetical protein
MLHSSHVSEELAVCFSAGAEFVDVSSCLMFLSLLLAAKAAEKISSYLTVCHGK